jgi:hypothetical protein
MDENVKEKERVSEGEKLVFGLKARYENHRCLFTKRM